MFERHYEKNYIQTKLNDIFNSIHDITKPKSIFVYGHYGTGKTTLVKEVLNEMNLDIIYYNSCDIRNKKLFDTFSNMNCSSNNILSVFKKDVKKIVIVLDEIDNFNAGDKCSINHLIKLVRPKKTKKQKLETCIKIPIICIGNHKIDKKIKEFMQVSYPIEIKNLNPKEFQTFNCNSNILDKYINGDIRKYNILDKLSKHIEINNELIDVIHHNNSFEESKDNVKELLMNKQNINNHSFFLLEQDRTITSMILHENIIDYLKKSDIDTYYHILKLICFSDSIDRITFQKQIWNMNEMTSINKTFNVHYLFHKINKNKIKNIRFTKILTKYSNEYNNFVFISRIINQLELDKDYFMNKIHNLKEEELIEYLYKFNINSLDAKRLVRYIDFFGQ